MSRQQHCAKCPILHERLSSCSILTHHRKLLVTHCLQSVSYTNLRNIIVIGRGANFYRFSRVQQRTYHLDLYHIDGSLKLSNFRNRSITLLSIRYIKSAVFISKCGVLLCNQKHAIIALPCLRSISLYSILLCLHDCVMFPIDTWNSFRYTI